MNPVGVGHVEGIQGAIVIQYDQRMSQMDSNSEPGREHWSGNNQLCPAVRFSLGIHGVDSHVVHLEIESEDHLRNLKHRDAPAAYVVPTPFLTWLTRFSNLVVHRKTKNKAKSLAQLMVGHALIPLICGGHRSIRQLPRSVEVLIERARAVGDHNLFFVGVDEPLLGQLLDNTRAARRRRSRAAQRSARRASPLEPETHGSEDIFVELAEELMEVDVPGELIGDYIGDEPGPDVVRRLIAAFAASSQPVLVLGPTGSGKELVANALHHYGGRTGRFLALNCSAIPLELFESELFGYNKGSHNMAYRDKPGLLELAENGTVFLDEIADLILYHQGKILRALEDHKIMRVGGTEEIPINARIIAATHRDLPGLVAQGAFREDLYMRLRGAIIPTPGLREHLRDLPILAHHLWHEVTGDKVATLPERVIRAIEVHDWPGNVRELKSVLRCLHSLFGTHNLNEAKLKTVFRLLSYSPAPTPLGPGKNRLRAYLCDCLAHLNRTQEVARACETSVKPLLNNQLTSRSSAKRLMETLNRSAIDLIALCQRPNLFVSEPLFKLTCRFADLVAKLSTLVGDNLLEAQRLWKSKMASIHRQLISGVFEETDNLLRAALKFPPGWHNRRGDPGAS